MSAPQLSAAEAATVARFEAGEAAPESWTGSQVAVDLRMAADVLERDGWIQGDYYAYADEDSETFCHCAQGAIATAITGDPRAEPDEDEGGGGGKLVVTDSRFARVEAFMRSYLDGDDVVSWNDYRHQTAANVVATLRAAADEADQP